MDKTIDALASDFATIRAGRANPHILDKLRVDYYGTPTPLNQVASIAVPEARQILIQPWDKSLINEIIKGIEKAETLAGRSHIIEAENYIIIDDCYNANPVSMRAALDLLETAEGRKVAIVGSMFE